ncbi:hypothetical protein NXS19_001202 [Fusarium pseudograminearum]|nr:hypothetical protein NXS19_001202 [Fusarium pseudograminearum]
MDHNPHGPLEKQVTATCEARLLRGKLASPSTPTPSLPSTTSTEVHVSHTPFTVVLPFSHPKTEKPRVVLKNKYSASRRRFPILSSRSSLSSTTLFIYSPHL